MAKIDTTSAGQTSPDGGEASSSSSSSSSSPSSSSTSDSESDASDSKGIGDNNGQTDPALSVEKADKVYSSVAQSVKANKVKPLPPGYVCNACGMKDDHAIYNCPSKIKGLNKKQQGDTECESAVGDKDSSSDRQPLQESSHSSDRDCGANSSNSTAHDSGETQSSSLEFTIFISGLPFTMKRNKLLSLLEEHGCGEGVTFRDVKLVLFDDNPMKCRGLAYVTYKSPDAMQKAINTLHGKVMGKLSLSVVKANPTSTNHNKKPTPAGNGPDKKRKKFASLDADSDAAVAAKQRKPRCYRCGGSHDPTECNNPRVCYRCRSTEHLSSDCPFKGQKRPKTK